MFENITRKFYAEGADAAGEEPTPAGDPIDQTSAVEVHATPKKTRIYADSEEKFLKRVVVYAYKATLGDPLKMYYDPDGLIPVYPDEAFNLFIKNLMVIGLPSITGIDGFRYFTPSSMVFDEGGYKFTIYDEGSVVFVYSSSNQTN